MSPFGGMPSGAGMPSGSDNMFGSNQDIDELIRNIDKQIAAIEEEERKEKEKNGGTPEKVEEKPIDTASLSDIVKSSPELEKSDNIEPKEDITFKPVEKNDEKEPNVSEIIPSNDIDLETFELKDKEEKKPETNESDYDDFFDDFFDE
jgi:hypothetical protein